MTGAPGQPSREAQAGEFEAARVWFTSQYDAEADRNPIYDRLFQPTSLPWDQVRVLDVGAGPISIFDHVAPATARVTAYDSLAAEYNQLVPDKKFPIVGEIPGGQFDLVAILNCLDHMDRPEELLEHVTPHLAPGGTMWMLCSIDQPYDPALHPQDFRFWQLITLVGRHFDIERCGLVREGPLFPYALWAVGGQRAMSPLRRRLRYSAFTVLCGLQYAWFYAVRAAVKGVKLLGGRRLLPQDMQF